MLSILIPSYLKEDLLQCGLYSIHAQALSIPYEVFVLNDGVDDGTFSICAKFPDLPIRYMFIGERNAHIMKWRCPGFAINIAVKECRGDIILIQQPEIYYVTANCIKDMLEHVATSPNKIVSPYGVVDTGNYLSLVSYGNKIEDIKGEDKPLDVRLPFCMMMHKNVFTDIGGYDEDFIGYCFDDNDLMDRLVANGCEINILKNHKIIHLYHSKRPEYRVGLFNRNSQWQYNKDIYDARRGTIIRNQNKDWGQYAKN